MLTTPKLGPKEIVSFIAFRKALTLDVKIVWFGCHVAVCVNKQHKSALFGCNRIPNLNFDCLLYRLLMFCSSKTGNIFNFLCPLWTLSSSSTSGTQIYSCFFWPRVTNHDVKITIGKK